MSFYPLYRSLGIRAEEVRTVGLFFLHHFFLGFGTMLIYVSANVILLENHPETSLPLAYMASAVGMMLVGKIYSYFEHLLLLDRLVIRVLGAVLVLTAVILVLVYFGHSVAVSVAIMVGFRAIYLLTNLEFWGVSAVVFDVRQSSWGYLGGVDSWPYRAVGVTIFSVWVLLGSDVYGCANFPFAQSSYRTQPCTCTPYSNAPPDCTVVWRQ
jgi:hypothetical protein